MTRIESDKVTVDKSTKKLFDFLTDFRNFEKLMPAQVSNWQADENQCSFTIQGMATVSMKMAEKVPNNLIRVVSGDKSPFEFELKVLLNEAAPGKTEGQMILEAKLNPFMKMVAEKPLGNFFNMMAHRIKDLDI